MELVQEFIEIHAEKELKRANEGNSTISKFSSFAGADVIMTIGGKVVGTLQPISMEVQRENRNNRIYSMGAVREASITMENVIVNSDILGMVYDQATLEMAQRLDNELLERFNRQHSMSISFLEQPATNRIERRKKDTIKKDEELHDGYKRNLHKMFGRGKKWN